MSAEYGSERFFAIPVNDPDSSYEYPEQVRLEIAQASELLMNEPRSFLTLTATTSFACNTNMASTAAMRAAIFLR
jgi:hypothetical protein